MSCEICGGNGHRRDLHDLADRIAKLEAAMLDSCTQCGNETRCAKHAARPVTTAAAGPIPGGQLKYVCRGCAVEMGALVKVEPPAQQPEHDETCAARAGTSRNCDCKPPAPAQGAPAEPLISECDVIHCRGGCRRCEVAALETRLATAERERDEAVRDLARLSGAVKSERERVMYHVETYEPRRDVPDDWTYQGALSRVADAIRDGKPAPK